MTKLLLQKLFVRARTAPKINKRERRRSGIIVVSSVASCIPIPGGITYGATKKSVRTFFHALSHEMKNMKNNVEVLTLMPAGVDTSMASHVQNRKGKGFATVTECVNGCLRDMSYDTETYGTLTHEIQGTLATFFSKFTLLYASILACVGASSANDRRKIPKSL